MKPNITLLIQRPLKFILLSNNAVLNSYLVEDAITAQTIERIINNVIVTIKHYDVKNPQLVIRYNEDSLIIPVHNNSSGLNFEVILGIEEIIWLNSPGRDYNRNAHLLSIAGAFDLNTKFIMRYRFHAAVMNRKNVLAENSSQKGWEFNLLHTRKTKRGYDGRHVINTNSYEGKTYMDYITQQPYKQKPYTNVAITN